MEAFLSLLNEAVVYQFLLLLARIVAFVAFMPVFGHAAISPTIRIAFAFYITVFLFPLVDVTSNINQGNFIISLVSEITLGLVASMLINILFSAIKVIGEFVEYSTSLSMAAMFDPTTGSQEGVIAKLLYWIALMLFLASPSSIARISSRWALLLKLRWLGQSMLATVAIHAARISRLCCCALMFNNTNRQQRRILVFLIITF